MKQNNKSIMHSTAQHSTYRQVSKCLVQALLFFSILMFSLPSHAVLVNCNTVITETENGTLIDQTTTCTELIGSGGGYGGPSQNNPGGTGGGGVSNDDRPQHETHDNPFDCSINGGYHARYAQANQYFRFEYAEALAGSTFALLRFQGENPQGGIYAYRGAHYRIYGSPLAHGTPLSAELENCPTN